MPAVSYRRGRACAAAVFTAVALITALLGIHMWPAGASGPPDRPVDRDIESYVLFAKSDLYFKGARPVVAATRGFIRGGDIGVNDPGMEARICENYLMHMDDGSQVVGDTVHATDNCDLYDIYTNSLLGSPAGGAAQLGPDRVFPAPDHFLAPELSLVRVQPGRRRDAGTERVPDTAAGRVRQSARQRRRDADVAGRHLHVLRLESGRRRARDQHVGHRGAGRGRLDDQQRHGLRARV